MVPNDVAAGNPRSVAQDISVALCTYNGEKFIAEQLESILAQSLLPAQIVVSDDGSTDDTVAIVRGILTSLRMRDLGIVAHVETRSTPLGVTANFESAMALCTGELIALCDQDDVWHPHKLERLREVFRDESVMAAHSDARIVNAIGEPLRHSLFESLHVSRAEFRREASTSAFSTLVRRNLVTGATAMFRRSVFDSARPFPDAWVHDYWLAIVSSFQGRIVALREPLVDYRQHSGNLIGASRVTVSSARILLRQPLRERHARSVSRLTELLSRVDEEIVVPSPRDLRMLTKKLALERRRAAFPIGRKARLPHTLRELFARQYHRYGRGFVDFVRDTWSS